MASILIVDDSVTLRTMLSSILCAGGHCTVLAENGQQALEQAKIADFDLVMTDINMPVIDGIELCRKLRQMQAYRFTPILMITTEGSEQMKSKGKAAGATGWLKKPFDPKKLIGTVDLLCGKAA